MRPSIRSAMENSQCMVMNILTSNMYLPLVRIVDIVGKGAVLNNRAFVENEASVMDGATMKTGATCGRKCHCSLSTFPPFLC